AYMQPRNATSGGAIPSQTRYRAARSRRIFGSIWGHIVFATSGDVAGAVFRGTSDRIAASWLRIGQSRMQDSETGTASSGTRAAGRRAGRGAGGAAARRAERGGGGPGVAQPYIRRRLKNYEVLDEEGLALIERNADTVLEEIGIEFRGDAEA